MTTLEGIFKVAKENLSAEKKRQLLAKLLAKKKQKKTQKTAQSFPLSFSQQRLWLLHQLQPESTAYHMPAAVRLRGTLQLDCLKRSLDALIVRHESLRTRIINDAGKAVQHIDKSLKVDLVAVFLDDPNILAKAIETALSQPFDLTTSPLMRVFLWKLSGHEHVLMINMHHIISDGWSMGIFISELTTLYQAFALNRSSPLVELPIQYVDFAHWQRQQLGETQQQQQLDYWLQQLDDVPVLDLVTDRVRPAVQSEHGKVYSFHCSSDIQQRVSSLAKQHGATPFMVLLATFQLLLGRLSNQTDLCVGSPVAGRSHAQTEGLIGFFVNTVVFRADLSTNATFEEFLIETRSRCLTAFDNQSLPFDQIVESLNPLRDMRYTPLFQAMLSVQNATLPAVDLDSELQIESLELPVKSAKFDLHLSITESPDGYRCGLEFNSDCFDDERIVSLAEGYSRLLQAVVSQPEMTLQKFDFLSGEERQQVVNGWNQTNEPLPWVDLVAQFEQQVLRTPDRIAVYCGQQQMDYQTLNQRANQLAHWLIKEGIGEGKRVAVCLHRSLDLLVALWGVIKSGGTYIPLDPAYPAARIALILEDSSTDLVLSERDLSPQLSGNIKCLDDEFPADQKNENPSLALNPERLFYLVYTSGSTGRPKGAGVRQSGEINLLHWYSQRFAFSPKDKTLIISALGFDLTQKNFFAPLMSGGGVVMPAMDQFDPRLIGEVIQQHGVTRINCAPSMFHALLEQHRRGESWPALESLKTVFLGGEPVNLERLRSWVQSAGCQAQVVNTYGPTECTDIASYYVIQSSDFNSDAPLPIGRPIDNVQIFVLDQSLNPVPVGSPGELCIAGCGVGLGYWQDKEKSDRVFVSNPFASNPHDRLYRSGDIVVWRTDGQLLYRGRVDNQIKLRGLRIEAGEIETLLQQQEEVRQALVLVRSGRLVAYLESDHDTLDLAQIKSRLAISLPAYMIPAVFSILPMLPLNAHGKIDTKALPDIDESSLRNEWVAPRNTLEEQVCKHMGEVLNLPKIGVLDHFFTLGGHSLLATQLVARLNEALDSCLSLRDIFEAPTVEALAIKLSVLEGPDIPPIQPVSHQQRLPLSFSQERLWFLQQMISEPALYHVPVALKLQGTLNFLALQQAFNHLIERHAILRTAFFNQTAFAGEDEWPVVQKILAPNPLKITRRPLDDQPVEVLLQQLSQSPFTLDQGCLLRVVLYSDEQQSHVLLLVMHHLITDAWSNRLLTEELLLSYQSLSSDDNTVPVLSDLPIQYADFAHWQRHWFQGEVADQQKHYWLEQLQGVPTVLNLPLDFPRPPLQTHRGAVLAFQLASEDSRALQRLFSQHQSTAFSGYLSIFALLLSRYSGQRDLCVGTPVSGRHYAGLEPLIGFFVNTLVLRLQPDADQSFTQFMGAVRHTVLNAMSHQDLPFEQLVESLSCSRDMSHSPLFQVMFTLTNAQQETLSLPDDLQVSVCDAATTTAKFDLTLALSEQADGTVQGGFEYNCDLFSKASIEKMSQHFMRLAQAVAKTPESPLSMLSMLGQGECQQQLVTWNDTDKPLNRYQSLSSGIHRWVLETPNSLAVTDKHGSLSYAELWQQAEILAADLWPRGVKAGTLVAVCLQRSNHFLVAVCAVLRLGAAWSPIDPEHPVERILFMLEDTQSPLLLTERALQPRLLDTACPLFCVEDSCTTSDALSLPAIVQDAHELAYVIYTSGSTGQPKGVCCNHLGVLNLLDDFNQRRAILPGMRCSFWTSASFDVSVYEMFSALLAGAELMVVPADIRLESEALLDWLRLQNIHSAYLPPFFVQDLANKVALEASGWSLKRLLVGVDSLSESMLEGIQQHLDDVRIINGYGPTETTVCATLYDINPSRQTEGDGNAPIGRPVQNSRVYVLDDCQQPVPVGVAGELFIGGLGLATGYLNRDELTTEKFIPDPFREDAALLYRTGDQVRYSVDGQLEFLGRVDFQIKVRGYRLEPGEIESALLSLEAVREALVMAHQDARGEQQLFSWVVLMKGYEVSAQHLRHTLKAQLPEYMIPTRVIFLAEMPLNASGKVDRQSLPLPNQQDWTTSAYVAPDGEVEETLAEIWSHLLDVDRVGVFDDFFQLGGHSLLATRMLGQIKQRFQVDLPLTTVFTDASLRALSEQILICLKTGDVTTERPLLRIDRSQPLPLSFAQERMWLLDQLTPGNPAYHIPLAVRFDGELDVNALQQSLEAIVERHESLRTVFSVDSPPRQRILPQARFPLSIEDLSGVAKAQQSVALKTRMREDIQRPFVLHQDCPVRGLLVKLRENRYVLSLCLHHIAADGWSAGILIRELSTHYVWLLRPRDKRPSSPWLPLPIQYADFAHWQRDGVQDQHLQQQVAYWKSQLLDVPILDLPTDQPRPDEQSFAGAVVPLSLDAVLSQRLQTLAQQQGVSLFMLLLSSWAALLSRLSGQTDLAIGAPSAGRELPEVEPLIGFFVNTLCIRFDTAADRPFSDWVQITKQRVLEAFAHQDIPFERLVEEMGVPRDLRHTPIFQTMFVLQNLPFEEQNLPDLSLKPVVLPVETAKFDLTLSLMESPVGLSGGIEYNSDCFSPETITRWLGHYQCLLQGLVEQPDSPVYQLPLMSEVDRHEALLWQNDYQCIFPVTECLHQRFAEQAYAHPEAIAISHQGQQVSYQQLDQQANQLAHYLVQQGVRADTLVGLCLPRNAQVVVAILAILKAGGAYVPLDPHSPAERLAFICEDADFSLLLSESSVKDQLPSTLKADVVFLDKSPALWQGFPLTAPEVAVSPTHLAYVIYTSGSTGQPKGVLLPHAQVMRLFAATQADFAFDQHQVWTLFHSYAFDFSVWEIWGALLFAARLVIVPQTVARSAEQFHALLVNEQVTVLNQTPSAFYALMRADEQPNAGKLALKTVVFGGEALDFDSLKPWVNRHGLNQPELINMYGITETTVHVTYRKLVTDDFNGQRGSLIGRPLADLQITLLDTYGQVVPVGISGEICVGGAGVARGYLKRPELTAERFTRNPFCAELGQADPTQTPLLYHSGDLARRLPDGELEYLGRLDFQVKLRGFRIELGEIESALGGYPDLRESRVLLRPAANGEDQLVAWCVFENEPPPVPTLVTYLQTFVPEYMIPSAFVFLEEFPLNHNGKIDQRQLLSPEVQRSREFISPRSQTEESLREIWSSLLSIEYISVDDNFFALGGHSLLATQLMSYIREHCEVDLPLRVLFERPTIAGLAVLLEEARQQKNFVPSVAIVKLNQDRYPLSYAQQRLWFLDQLEPMNAGYNVPTAVWLSGDLNIEALQQSLHDILQRHQVLRAQFVTHQGEAEQHFWSVDDFPLQRTDVQDQSNPEEAALQQAQVTASRPFNLSQDPLVRMEVIHVQRQRWLLLLVMHHMVTDAWSMGVLVRELGQLYRAYNLGEAPDLPELPIQYGDYAQWQQDSLDERVLAQQLAYWKNHLEDAPAVLSLPLDCPRPAVQTFNGAHQLFTLDNDVAEKCRVLCQSADATLFMGLLAIWQVLLGRYSGMDDIVVGIPIAGRTRHETEPLMGFFVNAVVMRTRLTGNLTFNDLLVRVREVALGAYAHQDIPGERVVEAIAPDRNLSIPPVAQVGFSLQNVPMQASHWPGCEISAVDLGQTTAKYDMTLVMTADDSAVQGILEYNTDLFKAESMRRMTRHFCQLAEAVVSQPDLGLDALSFLRNEDLFSVLAVDPGHYQKIYPLTATQRDLYLDSLLNPQTLFNSLGNVVTIRRAIDVAVWQQALQHLSDQQSVCRLRLLPSHQAWAEPVYLGVLKTSTVVFEYRDQSAEDRDDVAQQLRDFVYQPYRVDSAETPLLRHLLIKCSEQHFVAAVAAHHLLLDGISGTVYLNLISEVYLALENAQPAVDLAAKRVPDVFDSYVTESRQLFDSHAVYSFWKRQLASVEALGFPQTETSSSRGVQRDITVIDEDRWKAIRHFCRQHKLTPPNYFKALYGLLLKQYCRPEADFMVYEIVGGRNKQHRDALGCYYHQVPIVFKHEHLQSTQSLSDYFDSVRQFRKQLRDQQYVSVFLQNRLSPPGRLQFFYNYYSFPAEIEFLQQATSIDQHIPLAPSSQVQLVINAGKSEVELTLQYHRDFFNGEGVCQRLLFLSDQCVEGQVTRLGDVHWLMPAEQQQWQTFNDTFVEQTFIPLHQRFEQQVEKHPDQVACIQGATRLTYGELNHQANQLAAWLQEVGVARDKRVGVCLSRSPWMLVCTLAVWKAGGCYVPMDADYPTARLQHMLEAGQVDCLLTESSLLADLPMVEPTLCVDRDWDQCAQRDGENRYLRTQANQLCYLIFTSGSTGLPKGAAVMHQGFVNLVNWLVQEFAFDDTDRVLLMSAFGFDLTQKNLFAPLISGGAVVIPEMTHYDPEKIVDTLKTQTITRINAAPSAFYPILECLQGDFRPLSDCRHVWLGGESIDLGRLQGWQDSADYHAEVVNTYGPTECSDVVSYHRLNRQEDLRMVPLGKPLPNVRLFVVDEALNGQPIGVPGELCIAGVGVGRGYVNDAEQTMQRFVQNPFCHDDEHWCVRLYRSGDLVRFDGHQLSYLGRLDQQLKLRGLRIEPGEIEAALRQASHEQTVLVEVQDEQLVAYIQSHQLLDVNAMREQLGQSLPAYMVPAAFVTLPSFPLTANGKVDRKALPKPQQTETEEAIVAPESPLEWQLLAIFEQLLTPRPISVTRSFFALGGHSLLSVRLLSLIRQTFQQDISLALLFQQSSIRALAQVLENPQANGPLTNLIPLQPEGNQPTLFLVHGLSGMVQPFNHLAALCTDFPVVGIQACGLEEGSQPVETLDKMASHYVDLLRRYQPNGPYRLGGHSMGGLVAVLMAQKLAGEVSSLILFDSPSPQHLLTRQESQSWSDEAAQLSLLMGLSEEQLSVFLQQPLADQQQSLAQLLSAEDLFVQRMGATLLAHLSALNTIQELAQYDVPTLLLCAERTTEDVAHTVGWDAILSDLRCVPVAGDHNRMLDPPFIEHVAKVIFSHYAIIN